MVQYRHEVQHGHTSLGLYAATIFWLLCTSVQTSQGLFSKLLTNRKYFLLFGALCFFAHSWARPHIRSRLGSASRAYINFHSLYIIWLCSAVFYHLPSLESLGLNMKADTSLLIVVFLATAAALGAIHIALILIPKVFKLAASGTFQRRSSLQALQPSAPVHASTTSSMPHQNNVQGLLILLLLNSAAISLTCGTYHSLCGNGAGMAKILSKGPHHRPSGFDLTPGSSSNSSSGFDLTPGSSSNSSSSDMHLTSMPRHLLSLPENYYSVSASTGKNQQGGTSSFLRQAVCLHLLPPLPTELYPRFSSWMLYGEAAEAGSPLLTPPVSESAGGDDACRSKKSVCKPTGHHESTSTITPVISSKRISADAAALHYSQALNSSSRTSDHAVNAASVVGCSAANMSECENSSYLDCGCLEISNGTAVQDSMLSPVLIVWVTVMMLYLVNFWADSAASKAIQSRYPMTRRTATGGSGPHHSIPSGSGCSAPDADVVTTQGLDAVSSSSRSDKTTRGAEGWLASHPQSYAAKLRLQRRTAGAGSSGEAMGVAESYGLGMLDKLLMLGARKRAAMLDVKKTIQKNSAALIGSLGRAGMLKSTEGAALVQMKLLHVAEASLRVADSALSSATKMLSNSSIISPSAGLSLSSLGSTLVGQVAYRAPKHITSFLSGYCKAAASGPSENKDATATVESLLDMAAGENDVEGGEERDEESSTDDGPQPSFLPMVPWYSGTSADLLKTGFDLMITLKLFVGRFDMRTMQAATAASMADSFNASPTEGDGFTYEHLDERQEAWIDFIADTGDGGDSTYSVARALAAPSITVKLPDVHTSTLSARLDEPPASGGTFSGGPALKAGAAAAAAVGMKLPRGEMLLIGGDLAYPNPTRETYEHRLFRPFEDALPPPPHYHPGRLVVHKPDLPPVFGVHEAAVNQGADSGALRGLSPRSSRHSSSSALRHYSGPTCFAIPGNHDWIDGLYTYLECIINRGWLGGWLLPQEKSYFAIKLPQGWWVFGLDLALGEDIDIHQYRYFANVVEQRMNADDQVVIMTHQPLWLLDWFWETQSAPSLRQLVRGHLRGRARVHLAGDLHFYMRHSYTSCNASPSGPPTSESSCDDARSATKPEEPPESLPPPHAHEPPPESQPPPHAHEPPAPETLPTPGFEETSPDSAVCNTTRSSTSDSNYVVVTHKIESETSSGLADCKEVLQQPQDTKAFAHHDEGLNGIDIPTAHPAVPRGSSLHGSSDTESEDFTTSKPSSHMNRGGKSMPSRNSSMRRVRSYHKVSLGSSPPASSLRWLHEMSGSSPPGVLQLLNKAGGLPSIITSSAALNAKKKLPDALVLEHLGSSSSALDKQANSKSADAVALRDVALCSACRTRQAQSLARGHHHPLDPDHMICNGSGGAFLHPTHLFAGAAFGSAPDAAAAATAAIYSSVHQECTCKIYSSALCGWNAGTGNWLYPSHPAAAAAAVATTSGRGEACSKTASARSLVQLPATAVSVATSSDQQGSTAADQGCGQQPGQGGMMKDAIIKDSSHLHTSKSTQSSLVGSSLKNEGNDELTPTISTQPGQYVCQASYPSPEQSLKLGKKNLHLFRLHNTRFDVIGGIFYFLIVASVIPRCGSVAAILDADTVYDAISAAFNAYREALLALVLESYLSLGVTLFLFTATLVLAKGGGVGSSKEGQNGPRSPPAWAPVQPPQLPCAWARGGGAPMQLMFGFMHCYAHVSTALVLMLMLELGVETCIRYEQLGRDGADSLYNWYRAYEAQHFPDPMGVRNALETWTLGLYPGCLKFVFAVFDIPEAIAVARNAMCSSSSGISGTAALGGLSAVTRIQALAYYGGMLAYYWLLATPVVGLVFGVYLYLSTCWFGVHYDEAFSSLRIPHHKAVTRMHINKDGNLEIFTLAIDKVPNQWREDPKWRGMLGGGNPELASHNAAFPSRWIPRTPSTAATHSREGRGIAAGRRMTQNTHHCFTASEPSLSSYVKAMRLQNASNSEGYEQARRSSKDDMELSLIDYVLVEKIRPMAMST